MIQNAPKFVARVNVYSQSGLEKGVQTIIILPIHFGVESSFYTTFKYYFFLNSARLKQTY